MVAWLGCSLGVSAAHAQTKWASCKQMLCSLTVFFLSRCVCGQKGKEISVVLVLASLSLESCIILTSGVILSFLRPTAHSKELREQANGRLLGGSCPLKTLSKRPPGSSQFWGPLGAPVLPSSCPWPHASLFPVFEVS